jgi:hypothetical protein
MHLGCTFLKYFSSSFTAATTTLPPWPPRQSCYNSITVQVSQQEEEQEEPYLCKKMYVLYVCMNALLLISFVPLYPVPYRSCFTRLFQGVSASAPIFLSIRIETDRLTQNQFLTKPFGAAPAAKVLSVLSTFSCIGLLQTTYQTLTAAAQLF